MQRWIAIIGSLFLLLVVGGGTGFFFYKQSRPDKSYLPIPFADKATESEKQAQIAMYKKFLMDDKVLAAIAQESGAKEYWHLASDADALAEVRQRAFVEQGVNATDSGVKYDSIQIGFKGKKKEMGMLGKMSQAIHGELQKKQDEQKKRLDEGF